MVKYRAKYYLIYLLIIFSISFQSCDEERGIKSYIPHDAAAIVTLNTSNIVTKLLFENYSGINLKSFLEFSELIFIDSKNTNNLPLNKFFDQPTQLGLNLLDDIYLYFNDCEKDKQYFSGIFWKMSDADKFEQFLDEKIAAQYAIVIEDNNEYKKVLFEEYGFAFGWNKNLLVAIFPFNKTAAIHASKKVSAIFNLNPNASISKDTHFDNLTESDDDINIYARPDKLHSFSRKILPNTFNGGIKHFHAAVNFNNDLVKINIKQYLEEDALTLYEDLLSEGFQSDLFEQIDDSELVAFLNFKYDKGFLPKFIKFYNLKLALKAIIAATGVNEKELYELTNGDISIAYARNNMHQDHTISSVNNNEELITDSNIPCFVAELKTGPKMPSFLDTMTKNGLLNKQADIYNLKEVLGYDAFIKLNKDKMLVTNDSSFVFKRKRRIIPEPDREIQKLSGGYPVSAYINFDRFLKEHPTKNTNAFLNDNFYEAANLLKTLSFYTKPLENNVMDSKLEIKFKNENSLSTLIHLFSILEKNSKKPS